ncbi:MAG: SCP2 sterol-binding domain-containing protein [Steroidobacteraceae bacterium]
MASATDDGRRVMIEDPLAPFMARALAASPRARELCQRLTGRRLQIAVTGVAPALQLRSDGARLHLERSPAAAGKDLAAATMRNELPGGDHDPSAPPTLADARLEGDALALAGLLAGDAQGLIRRGSLRLEGDAEVARQFSELLELLKPDPEELLGRMLGRIPAHALMLGARSAMAWGRSSAHQAAQTLADYLAHEQRTLVPRAEAEHLTREIEALTEQLDRTEARLGFAAERLARRTS